MNPKWTENPEGAELFPVRPFVHLYLLAALHPPGPAPPEAGQPPQPLLEAGLPEPGQGGSTAGASRRLAGARGHRHHYQLTWGGYWPYNVLTLALELPYTVLALQWPYTGLILA